MNTIDKIDDITLESQIDVLSTMESSITKQFIMESYYMEEETNKPEEKENVGKAPKVDGVNALQRFWNWVKRCIYVIKTWLHKLINGKKIEKLKSLIKNKKDSIGKRYEFPEYEYDLRGIRINSEIKSTITDVIGYLRSLNMEYNKKNITEYLTSFSQTANYQRECEYLEKDTGLNKISTNKIILNLKKIYENSNNPNSIYYVSGDNVDAFISFNELELIAEDVSEYAKAMYDINLRCNKIIKNEKAKYSDDIIKSNNFQQYIRFISILIVTNLNDLKVLTYIVDIITQILSNKKEEMII